MGAVTFSLDSRLVASLKSVLPLTVLVETGTFKGDTVAEFESSFNKVVSIELSKTLWFDAVKRFEQYQHVQILQGSSSDQLRELASELQNTATLYWLDAHWCAASDTAGDISQCPLLHELQAIGKLNSESVLLIDDARLFLSPPLAPHEISQWPSFHQILSCLLSMSNEHELMVVNDVIAFFPSKAKGALEQYAQFNGIDWLVAANCAKENKTFIQQIADKEEVIQQLIKNLNNAKADLAQMQSTLIEKESVIQVLSKAVTAYRVAQTCNPIWVIKKTLARFADLFAPRLGNLNQYAPRSPVVPTQPLTINQLINTPKISIVTPSFRQGGYIERTIKSVLDQKYPNLEYFVQDGGSQDDTVAVLRRYESALSGWVSEKDSGQSQAINLGFAHTSGDIMAWLNSDDLLLPGALAVVIDYFNKHPEVDVIYGNRLLIDENDLEIGRWILPCHDGNVLSWADYIPQETMFWRRSIWDKAGGQIDESFRFAMDWDLLVRFREAGAKFAHIPVFLGAFRIHEQQKTSAAISEIGYQEMNRIRERLLGRVPSRKEIRKHVALFMLKHIAVDFFYRIKLRVNTFPIPHLRRLS
jgi:glycosyltransferase involved in cell wall biosynthesis/antitoxin component HigA of HigAB toxin-antitoxin module